jgi:hypothetical protein
MAEGPSDRIPLYLDSLAFPCSDSRHNKKDGFSTIRGHDNKSKDADSKSLLTSPPSPASTASNRVGASRDDYFNRYDDGYYGSFCRIRNFMENSELSVSDCSSCFGSQQLVVYNQGTSDVLVQVNDFCAKCETFSFARAKLDTGGSVSLLVEQGCVDMNPSSCQRSQTVFTVACGFGWYRPEGFAECLPCPNGMSKPLNIYGSFDDT